MCVRLTQLIFRQWFAAITSPLLGHGSMTNAHHLGQVFVEGIALSHKTLDQCLELGLTLGHYPLPSRVPAISWISSTCFRSTSCSGFTASKPLSMQPAKRLSCSSGTPFLSSKFRWIESRTSPKALPSANRRMKRPTLIVVEDAPNHGAAPRSRRRPVLPRQEGRCRRSPPRSQPRTEAVLAIAL